MLNRSRQQGDLPAPPMASTDPRAVEVLRARVTPGGPCQLTLRTLFDDPGTRGLPVDVARCAALAYSRDGHDEAEALRRMRRFLELERETPTPDVTDLTDRT